MQKKAISIGLALFASFVLVVVLVFVQGGGRQQSPDSGGQDSKAGAVSRRRGASPRPESRAKGSDERQGAKKKARRPMPQIVFDDPDHPYSAADKRIARELQDALDNCTADTADDESDEGDGIFSKKQSDAQSKLMKAASAAAASDNPSVRLRAVEAYSWIGKDALPEVTVMMADSDENVAEQAIEAVGQSLLDIDDSNDRFQLATTYMSTFSSNENALSMLGGISSGAALALMEPASDSPADVAVALENRQFFVDTVSALVEGGQGKCSEHAQSLYEEVTGSPWIDADEGERWATNPDGYEAPETPEPQDVQSEQGEPRG